jgi:hypothetical protein
MMTKLLITWQRLLSPKGETCPRWTTNGRMTESTSSCLGRVLVESPHHDGQVVIPAPARVDASHPCRRGEQRRPRDQQ